MRKIRVVFRLGEQRSNSEELGLIHSYSLYTGLPVRKCETLFHHVLHSAHILSEYIPGNTDVDGKIMKIPHYIGRS